MTYYVTYIENHVNHQKAISTFCGLAIDDFIVRSELVWVDGKANLEKITRGLEEKLAERYEEEFGKSYARLSEACKEDLENHKETLALMDKHKYDYSHDFKVIAWSEENSEN